MTDISKSQLYLDFEKPQEVCLRRLDQVLKWQEAQLAIGITQYSLIKKGYGIGRK